MAVTLDTVNPFRYRGYMYDAETRLYGLHSKYNPPDLERLISPDSYVAAWKAYSVVIYVYYQSLSLDSFAERLRFISLSLCRTLTGIAKQ